MSRPRLQSFTVTQEIQSVRVDVALDMGGTPAPLVTGTAMPPPM